MLVHSIRRTFQSSRRGITIAAVTLALVGGLLSDVVVAQGAASRPENYCLQDEAPWGPARAVAAGGSLAVVGSGAVASFIEVASLPELRVVADLELPAQVLSAVFVDDRHALLADRAGGLSVVDVAIPSAPAVIGTLALPVPAVDLAVGDGFAVAALGDYGIAIVDLGDLTNPSLAARAVRELTVPQVAVHGTVAYLAGTVFWGSYVGGAYLILLDLADPSHPVELVSRVVENRLVTTIDLLGSPPTHAVLTSEWRRLFVLDVSDPGDPHEVASLALRRVASDVAIRGTTACVAAEDGHFIVVDLTDPGSPYQLARRDLGFSISLVEPIGDRAVVTGPGGVQLVDLQVPSAPAVVGSLDALAPVVQLAVDDGLLFVLSLDGVRIFDTVATRTPGPLGSFGLSDRRPLAFTVDHDRVYVVSSGYPQSPGTSLRVYDVADLHHPALLGELDGFSALSIEPLVVGDSVVLVESDQFAREARLSVVAASDPARMTVVGSLEFQGLIPAAAASGRLVYATRIQSGANGVDVIDVSEPDRPVRVGGVATGAWSPLRIGIGGSVAVISAASGLRAHRRMSRSRSKSASASASWISHGKTLIQAP